MSVFFKVFAFLFLLFSQFAFASNTFTYWANRGSTFCATGLNAVCNSYDKSLFVHGSSCVTTNLECSESFGNGMIKFTGTCPTSPVTNFTDFATSVTYYTKRTLECANNEKMELTGCSAKCVIDPEYKPPEDKCLPYKDQIVNFLVPCGTASCFSGGVILEGNPMTCSNGAGVHLRSPVSSTVVAGCTAELPKSATGTLVKVYESVGKSSTPAFCYADYTYTGISSSDQPPITGVTDLSFIDFVPTTEDGSCPPEKPRKGEFNGVFVCYANDSGTGTGTGGTGTGGDGTGTGTGGTGTGTGGTGTGTGGTGTGTGGTGTGTGGTGTGTGGTGTGTGGTGTGTGGTGTGTGGTGTGTGGTGTGTGGTGTGTGGTGTGTGGTGTGTGGTGTGTGGGGGGCATGCSATASNKCDVAPTCSGDVIQCGFILQEWHSICDLKESLTGLKEGESAKYDQVGTNSNDARVAAAKTTLTDKVNDIKAFIVPPSAGSCPADIRITVMSKIIVLPIFNLCPLFQLMRFLLHLIVNLLCLRILYSSFVRV